MAEAEKVPLPRLPLQSCLPKRRRLTKKEDHPRVVLTGAQRLLLLDTWRRSQLAATDFAPLVGLTKHSLYAWKRRFEDEGPAGLADKPRGSRRGSRVPEVMRRSILLLKEDNPDWGCQWITDVSARGPGLGVSTGSVARALHDAGYELEERQRRIIQTGFGDYRAGAAPTPESAKGDNDMDEDDNESAHSSILPGVANA